MPKLLEQKSDVVDSIRSVASQLARAPSRSEFKPATGVSEYQILTHFPGWREALRASGFEPRATNVRLDDKALLEDWGALVRKHRHMPTRSQYRKEGRYSPGVFERHFGPWSAVPERFRSLVRTNPNWADVAAIRSIFGVFGMNL
jgi:hypothetical protein